MPVFYFDVRSGNGLTEDLEGAEFPDLAAAENEARAAVLELARHRLLETDEIRVEVRDGGKTPVLIATATVTINRELLRGA